MSIPTEEHVCAVCRVALDYAIDDDGTEAWVHPLGQILADPTVFMHEPEPIPAAEVANEGRYHCDFCMQRSPTWRYPCGDFDTDIPGAGSAGDWAACDECHVIVEAHDTAKLVYRALRGPTVVFVTDRHERDVFERHLRGLFREFYAHRTGDAVPI